MTERMQGEKKRKIFYNKLVRDDIEARIKGKGENCEVRTIADDAEFEQELLKKVREEASSLAHSRSREQFLDEYADLIIVLQTLTTHLGLSDDDLHGAVTQNIATKGHYTKRHYLHWSEDGAYQSNETPQGLISS
jgi:predicted house-cleaning noncanonical NTP pyrophosphatase (MazG superfamily)